jgi:hypothetical protein
MKVLCVAFTLGCCAAVATLAGCDESQPPIGAPGAVQQQGHAIATRADLRGSLMPSEKSGTDLLYVTNLYGADATVYKYPRGAKPVQYLSGTQSLNGACTDKSGDVFITTGQPYTYTSTVMVFAHGRGRPIRTLKVPIAASNDCSVDPGTGDLAVVSGGGPYQTGGVAIFRNASGKPTVYKDAELPIPVNCGYDGSGNLFIDGYNPYSEFAFAELSKEARAFTNIKLNVNVSIPPGSVQWDGQYVAVGSVDGDTIYQFTISGSSGREVGSTTLDGPDRAYRFWIQGGKVAVAAASNDGSKSIYEALIYRYPAGGSPIHSITNGVSLAQGVTISLAHQGQVR